MQYYLMRRTTIYSVLFLTAALISIYYMAAQKEIIIDHIGQDDVSIRQEQGSDYLQADGTVKHPGTALSFEIGMVQSSHLCIPLPQGTKAEEVKIENYYMDDEMHVMVNGNQKEFYDGNVISGKKENVTSGYYEVEEGITRLTFYLNGIYEYKSILENGNLYIEFMAPGEIYDRIIVIDPALGGSSAGYRSENLLEKDLSLAIAQKVKEKLDGTVIKVYDTRMDDYNPSEEKRIQIANETKADMYIRIEGDYAQDESIYGTTAVYNEHFFIPGFGSVELANILEYEVVSAISGKALGMIAAGEEDITIKKATVPAATIKVGYLSNKQEAILLGREDYIARIADGIYHTVINVYDEYLGKDK